MSPYVLLKHGKPRRNINRLYDSAKVMSITVETGHELQGTINPMIPAVRENLNALGYSLTGITAKKRQEPVDPSHFLDEHFHKISEKGLDLRV